MENNKTSIDKKQKPDFVKRHGFMLFFSVMLIYLELVFNLFVYAERWGTASIWNSVLYVLLFSVMSGGIMYLVSSLSKSRKVNFAISLIFSILLFLLFSTQFVYFSFFRKPLTLNSIGGAEQLGDFVDIIVNIILKNHYVILLFAVPMLFLIFFGRKVMELNVCALKKKGIVFAACVVFYFVGIASVGLTAQSPNGAYDYYYNIYDVASTQRVFGVVTNFRLDIKKSLFGFSEKINNNPVKVTEPTSERTDNTTEPKKEYGYNILDIDFDSLIQSESDEEIRDMHEYFSRMTGTRQNDYTGIFKDCNLIMLCCESFSSLAVDKDLTPTLYKLATEGFEFTNFYNPVWWTSTTDGEYTGDVGLVPKSGVWSHSTASDNSLPFCLGNQFNSLGYDVYAYHNHTYTFYNRNLTYPAMGYKNYKARGNGLNVAGYWPESDLEMMQKTVYDYVNDDSFHTYYMTVSGHAAYTYLGNYMASKNRRYVEDRGLSEGPSAYLACNLELEFAMEYLLNTLKEAGKLENTVIVMYGDHYPYSLSEDEINELAGHTVDTDFELYKSTLVIWKYGMEHTVVDKTMSTLDILPTVSNLFGLKYDSRLLAGSDIFSDDIGLAMLSDRSWITDEAKYNASTGEVISLNENGVSEEYIEAVNSIVKQKFVYSTKILENDYWAKVIDSPSSTE